MPNQKKVSDNYDRIMKGILSMKIGSRALQSWLMRVQYIITYIAQKTKATTKRRT